MYSTQYSYSSYSVWSEFWSELNNSLKSKFNHICLNTVQTSHSSVSINVYRIKARTSIFPSSIALSQVPQHHLHKICQRVQLLTRFQSSQTLCFLGIKSKNENANLKDSSECRYCVIIFLLLYTGFLLTRACSGEVEYEGLLRLWKTCIRITP